MERELDNRALWQKNCDSCIALEQNVILSSPTGTGKTARYEIWAFNKMERPIFVTSPIKSLSNQKFRDFLAKGYRVGLETGDIKYMPCGADIICCTQEIYNNKYRDLENSTLIIDEFSYVFENEDRARAYIDSLYFSKAKNILICSATFGNARVITDYINNLTGRNFYLYENKERLTTLRYDGYIRKANIRDSLVIAYSKNKCIKIAEEIYRIRVKKINGLVKNSFSFYNLLERNKNQILRFVKKYNIDNKELISLTYMGVAYYYSELYPKEKLFLEELFENKLIDTIVGTDALALGVNFPIKNVIFTGFYKYGNNRFEMISKNLFEQISGRAGRKGYFDTGYVYYCDDFIKKSRYSEGDLDDSFYELVNRSEGNADIILTSNIKNILNGNVSIGEEADFIIKYSTTCKNYEEEEKKIIDIIDYINSYDITLTYLKRTFNNLDWDLGYDIVLEGCTPKFRRKIDKLLKNLEVLQTYFNKDIGRAYMIEYSYKLNCEIFMDILISTPMEELINRYGKTFYDLLLLKKYIGSLPEKYLSLYDITVLDDLINSIDYTALHPNEFKIDNIERSKNTKQVTEKVIKIYECPNYFERMIIEGREYIKLFNYNNFMVVCDCSSNVYSLVCFPKDVQTKTVGFIKNSNRLDILNNIDISSLNQSEEEIKDRIEGTKLYLKKKIKKK